MTTLLYLLVISQSLDFSVLSTALWDHPRTMEGLGTKTYIFKDTVHKLYMTGM